MIRRLCVHCLDKFIPRMSWASGVQLKAAGKSTCDGCNSTEDSTKKFEGIEGGPLSKAPEEIWELVTEVQKFQLRLALDHSAAVLRAIKSKALTGSDLKTMKTLETAVQSLEAVVLIINQ